MGNIDSRVSPFCILQAAIVSGIVQSNSALAFPLKQLTLVAAGAIPSRVSGLSVVSLQVQRCLEIKHFSSGRIASGHLSGRTHGQLYSATEQKSRFFSNFACTLILTYNE